LNIKKTTAAGLALLATVTLSGCSLQRYVPSLDPYAPSDGTQLDIEDLKARNLMFVKGKSGNAILLGSFVNSGRSDITAQLQTKDKDGNDVRYSFLVGAGKKLDLGFNEGSEIVLPIGVLPGSMYSIYIAGNSDPVEMLVPVLDGTLEEYRKFASQLD
jgi:hypothetical protein